MGSFNGPSEPSQSAPWSVDGYLYVPPRPELKPLWQPLPWHLKHVGWFAVLLGPVITGIFWLLLHL